MYASSPIHRVIGECCIADILALSHSGLWVRTQRWSGIDRTDSDEYFQAREVGCALKVESPQGSWRYSRCLGLRPKNRRRTLAAELLGFLHRNVANLVDSGTRRRRLGWAI